jgi:hypothetical protein
LAKTSNTKSGGASGFRLTWLEGGKNGKTKSVVAVFVDHSSAEDAFKKLAAAGLAMKSLSVVGKGYRSEERSLASTRRMIESTFGASVVRFGVASGACSLAERS